MPHITLPSGAHFDCGPGESLLDAATRARVVLSYSCRKGRCSNCKCRVVSGNSIALAEELGLSAEEQANGWVLTCVRTAISDMTIQADDFGGLTPPAVRTLPCRIHTKELLSVDVMSVVLRLPPTSDFTFLPGQYIDVIAQGGVRRSYSLANAPSTDELLQLHIHAVLGGAMSKYWFEQAKVNDLLRLSGPLGTFFLRNVVGIDLVFLATGTGIAPVKSILEGMNLTNGNRPRSVTVYWGGRSVSDLYWNMGDTTGLYHFVPVLSRADVRWPGARGHVQHVALAEKKDFSEVAVYACGSDAMIHDSKRLLVAAGLPESRFYSDAFVCSDTN
jgi:CDP-4-dehydro-6-deoxyglucose reductase, E3